VWQIPAVTAGVTLTSASLSPSALTFTGQTVGTASATQTFTVN